VVWVLASESLSDFERIVERVVRAVEVVGIAVLLAGGLVVLVTWLVRPNRWSDEAYHRMRRMLGRVILLGLEVLVAADLIRTVIVEPTLTSVAALGLLVLVRTLLSWSIIVELEGTLPWRTRAARTAAGEARGTPPPGQEV
jgi:uncharacterized membrane protein